MRNLLVFIKFMGREIHRLWLRLIFGSRSMRKRKSICWEYITYAQAKSWHLSMLKLLVLALQGLNIALNIRRRCSRNKTILWIAFLDLVVPIPFARPKEAQISTLQRLIDIRKGTIPKLKSPLNQQVRLQLYWNIHVLRANSDVDNLSGILKLEAMKMPTQDICPWRTNVETWLRGVKMKCPVFHSSVIFEREDKYIYKIYRWRKRCLLLYNLVSFISAKQKKKTLYLGDKCFKSFEVGGTKTGN